jgi:hypothetical protein
LRWLLVENNLLFAVGVFSILKENVRGLVWTNGCDLGCVVVVWTGRRQQLFGVVVVVGIVKDNIEHEFRQQEQKQKQEQEPIGS